MYAVIALQWHQYLVKEGDQITVDQLEGEPGQEIVVSEVLASFDDKGAKVAVGSPFLAKAKVLCTLDTHAKGDKLHITKFKRKNRYERKIGFRAKQTLLTVKSIVLHE